MCQKPCDDPLFYHLQIADKRHSEPIVFASNEQQLNMINIIAWVTSQN